MGKFKITSDFIIGTTLLIVGWSYELAYWLFFIINIQGANLNYDAEEGGLVIAGGILSLALAIGYSSIYFHALKEKINRIK